MTEYALLLKHCNCNLYFVGYSGGYPLFSPCARTYKKEDAKKLVKHSRHEYRLIAFDVPDPLDV